MSGARPWHAKGISDRLALSTVTLRRLPLEEALSEVTRLGFEAVDLAALRGLCEHVPPGGTPEELRDVAEVVNRSGLRVVSVNADPGSFDGHDDQKQVLDRVEHLTEFCRQAHVPRLVLPAGEKTDDPAAEPRLTELTEGLDRAANIAHAKGVELVVEAPYFGRPVNSLARAQALIRSLGPRVRVAYDVSHIAAAGESVVDGFALLAERTAVVHLRDAVPGDIRRPIGHGGIDFEAFLSAARQCSYDGDHVLELETRPGYFTSKQEEITEALALLARTAGVIA